MANNTDWGKELYGKSLINDTPKSPTFSKQGQQNMTKLPSWLQGLVGVSQGAGNVARAVGLGAVPDLISQQPNMQAVQKMTGINPAADQPNIDQMQKNPLARAGQDAAGAASYLVPETKILQGGGIMGHLLGGAVNRGIQGGIQGGLGAVSQGQNPVQGAIQGAVVNPAIAGAGAALTDTLPRYIGLRNFGAPGLSLPEVTKAENAAGDSLYNTRNDTILKNIKSFDTRTSALSPDRQDLLTKIQDLAKEPMWDGTTGLSDLKKTSKKAFPIQTGKLADIQAAIQNSDNPFQAYNKIHNMAYPKDNSPAENRLAGFMKSAAHVVREHLINTSDNPAETKKAMDLYAAQQAIGRGNKGKLLNIPNAASGGEAAVAALASIIPGLQGFGLPAMADLAVTNPLTGPPLARGLVNAGQNAKNSGASALMRRLGIAGAQNAINSQ